MIWNNASTLLPKTGRIILEDLSLDRIEKNSIINLEQF